MSDTKKMRKPWAGRKRKLTRKQEDEIYYSKSRVTSLARKYGVKIWTIYITKKRVKHRIMNIEVELQPDNIPTEDCENCIFCNENTAYWHIASNRPVCAMCSVIYRPDSIPGAPYNY